MVGHSFQAESLLTSLTIFGMLQNKGSLETKGQVPGTAAAAVSVPGPVASSQRELQSHGGGSAWRVC